jgi:hypothetical protein
LGTSNEKLARAQAGSAGLGRPWQEDQRHHAVYGDSASR